MLIELSIACAAGAIGAWQMERIRLERRRLRRQEQLLMGSLREAEPELDGHARRNFSRRKLEMELCLLELETAAQEYREFLHTLSPPLQAAAAARAAQAMSIMQQSAA